VLQYETHDIAAAAHVDHVHQFPCCATAFGSLPPEITLSTSDKLEPLTLNTETLPLPAFTANSSE
jgi:hypothetical protein